MAGEALVAAANDVTGEEFTSRTVFKGLGDHLIATDVAAPPGYVDWKRQLLTAVDVTWVHFFNDPDADLDWRLVTFGGVLADTPPLRLGRDLLLHSRPRRSPLGGGHRRRLVPRPPDRVRDRDQ